MKLEDKKGNKLISLFKVGKEQKKEFGFLYKCRLDETAKQMHTEEIGMTRFWNLVDPIGEVAELDVTLAELVMKNTYIDC